MKRAKTLTTYAGSTKASRVARAADGPAFATLPRDEESPQHTAHAIRFSDHSDAPNSPQGLPNGTLQDDFVNHNPNVMFRDSGSTVAYNESSEQRMLEQALNSTKRRVSSAAKLAESDKNTSSPYLWSSNTQSPTIDQSKTSRLREHLQGSGEDDDLKQNREHLTDLETEEQLEVLEKPKPQAKHDSTKDMVPEDDRINVQTRKRKVSALPNSSPQVIVHTKGAPEEIAPAPSVQKATQGVRRKASTAAKEESSESLNSDDRLIGLPKEQYQPKPSKRRMTQLPKEPIDYSVVPEKAAKKRRKTLNDAGLDADIEVFAETQRPKSTQKKTQARLATAQKPAHENSVPAHATPGTPEVSASLAAQTLGSPVRPIVSPLTSPEQARSKQAKPSLSPTETAALLRKPSPSPSNMGPPSLPASLTKKRVPRSHTTIFEDCSQGSQKSPSLSQQQADRRSALQGTGRRKTPANRPRRRIVQDDEDDVDELSKELDEEVPAAKKRGRPSKAEVQKQLELAPLEPRNDVELSELDNERVRKRGRNSQTTQKTCELVDGEGGKSARPPMKRAKAKAAEKMLGDSEVEERGKLWDESEAAEEPTTEKNRGTTAKAKSPDTPLPDQNQDKATSESNHEIEKALQSQQSVLKPKDMNAQPTARRATPAPDVEKTKVNTPQQPLSASKPGPLSHSPIKKTSKLINHRIGLNKRSRIPPLLKIVRPVQQRKEVERVTKVTSVAELERMAAEKLEE